MTHKNYTTLDALRGIAAIAVVGLHAETMINPSAVLLPGAYLAVDLFFVLSGFVLEHAYGARLATSMTPRRFLTIRYIRLYPLFALGALLGAFSAILAVMMGAGELSGGSVILAIASAAFLLPSPTWFESDLLFPVNVPGWSLVYELMINAVFVVAYRHLTARVLLTTIVISGIALIGAVFDAGSADLGSGWSTALGGIPRVTFSFFVGVVVRRYVSQRRVEVDAAWVIPLIVIPLFMVSAGSARPIFDLLAVLLLFPLIIAIGATYEIRPAGHPLARMLGLISFPIYAIHYPVLEVLRRVTRVIGLERYYEPAAVVICLGLAAISILLVRYFDEPVRRWLTAFVSRRSLRRHPLAH